MLEIQILEDISSNLQPNGPCACLLKSTALQDITTTPAPIAVSAVLWQRTKGSLVRTTAWPVRETPQQILMAQLISCSAKVRS